MPEMWLLLMVWAGAGSMTGGVAAPTMVPFATEQACLATGERLAARAAERWRHGSGWRAKAYDAPQLRHWECVRNG